MDHRTVRRHNLALVLGHIARRGARSRAQVARETGLNKATVSSLVADLVGAGLLRARAEERTGRVGRPSQVLELDGRAFVSLGIQLDVDHFAVMALDFSGRVRHEEMLAEKNDGRTRDALVARLCALAESALASVGHERLRAVALTIAVPGLVDFERGTVAVSPNLDLRDIPLAALVFEQLGRPSLPVFVDNEANLGALAELIDGAGRGCSNFVYVSGGVGIGAGVVIGGRLYRGRAGFSGELGHMAVDTDGPQCNCGNRGCLEAIAGLDALLRRAGVDRRPNGTSAAAAMANAARGGEPEVLAALTAIADALGLGCASVANLVNPQRIILGGYLAELSQWLIPHVDRALKERFVARRFAGCELVSAQLGPGSQARGASRHGLDRLLQAPDRLIAISVATDSAPTRPQLDNGLVSS